MSDHLAMSWSTETPPQEFNGSYPDFHQTILPALKHFVSTLTPLTKEHWQLVFEPELGDVFPPILADPGPAPVLEDLDAFDAKTLPIYAQRYNLLQADYDRKSAAYRAQQNSRLTATQKINAYFDLLLPARLDGTNWRVVLFGSPEAYRASTPRERANRLVGWFTTGVDVNATVAEFKEKLRTLTFIHENEYSFVNFQALFNKYVAFTNDLLCAGEKLTENTIANYLIAALKRCPDFKNQIEFTAEMFQYERHHNDHSRQSRDIFEFASHCAQQISRTRTVKNQGYAHAAADVTTLPSVPSLLEDDDDDSSAEQTAFAAARLSGAAPRAPEQKRRPQAGAASPTPAARGQGITVTITATASEPNALQPALARLLAGVSAAPAARSALNSGGRLQPGERARFCWSCGTTRGENAHTSKNCPSPRKGHQAACTYANREQFPGFKPPATLK